MVVVAFVSCLETDPGCKLLRVVDGSLPVADFHILMLAVVYVGGGSVGHCLGFLRTAVVGTLPYVIAHIHLQGVPLGKRVLVAEQHIGAAGIAALAGGVGTCGPYSGKIGAVYGIHTPPFVAERTHCTDVERVFIVGFIICTQPEKNTVVVAGAATVGVEVRPVIVAAARFRATRSAGGFKSEGGEAFEMPFVVIYVRIGVHIATGVASNLGTAEVSMAMVFLEPDVYYAGSTFCAVFRRGVGHHLDALDVLGRNLAQELGTVIGVHAHGLAVDPHQHIVVATQGYVAVGAYIHRGHRRQQLLGGSSGSGDVGAHVEHPSPGIHRHLAALPFHNHFLQQFGIVGKENAAKVYGIFGHLDRALLGYRANTAHSHHIISRRNTCENKGAIGSTHSGYGEGIASGGIYQHHAYKVERLRAASAEYRAGNIGIGKSMEAHERGHSEGRKGSSVHL